jgi:hypothetical protein
MRKMTRKQKQRTIRLGKASARRSEASKRLKKALRGAETQLYQELAAQFGSRRDRGWDKSPGDDPAAAARAERRELEREVRSFNRAIRLKKQ